ncbi:methyltransferase domain-containing protein [Bacillus sp. S3]|uniref:methyltransferase domain-containing protein n=1 Tax=Bacillus sp. S3 TaxID=486398 RepID=UPI001680C287|nr:methyltransferase domain-containing protein [Bacillus sp. S3]
MTKKPLDRISEAYKGNMGEDFSVKTRNRINWIVNQVKGEHILDIGCSQGVVPIILGREGKNVDAIDIAQESIDYAKSDLENEHATVQQKVTFKVANFMTEKELESSYETILLTEVLEHISDPYSFLKKIFDHLENDGLLVVTVPFGINDYFDHKRTYYFLDLYDHLSTYFSIEKIEYLGNWVGVVCKKTSDTKLFSNKGTFSREVIEKLEKAFYTVERGLVTRIENFQHTLRQKNEYVKNLQAQHSQSIEKYKEQVVQRDHQIKVLNDYLSELKKVESKNSSETIEERETNRRLLQQVKEQNHQIHSLIDKVENQHRSYIENFNKQIEQKEIEIYNLRENLEQLTILSDKKVEELVQKNVHIEELKEQLEQNKMEFNLAKEINKVIQEELKKEIEQSRILLTQENEKNKVTEKKLKIQCEEMNEKDDVILELNKQVTMLKTELLNTLQNEEKGLKHYLKDKEELQVQSNFNHNHKQLLEEMNEKDDVILERNKQVSMLKTELMNTLNNEEKELNHYLKEKEELKVQLNSKVKQLLEENKIKDDVILERNKQLTLLKTDLLNNLNHEESELNHYLKDKEELNQKEQVIKDLENKLNLLERRYLALKNSKLGSLTIKYWQMKRNSAKKISRG